MAKVTHYTVRDSIVGVLDGHEVEYIKGEVVLADDPAVQKWPAHFEPLVVRDHIRRRDVEAATAAPGEKRG